MARIEAAFDCLTVVSLVRDIRIGPSPGEIHLLTYLASLLAIYERRGEGATAWGYNFASTPSGAPFSSVLSSQIELLLADRALVVEEDGLQLTEQGRALREDLAALRLTAIRIGYLDSASSTLLALPPGVVRAALGQSQVIPPHLAANARLLASETMLPQLYSDFEVLANALGPTRQSLLAASVLWVSYLVEQMDSVGDLDD